MKLKHFIKDFEQLWLGLSLFLVISTLYLNYFNVQILLIAFIDVLFILSFSIPLSIYYIRKKKTYESTLNLLNRLDKKYLLADLMNQPDMEIDKLYYDILQETNKAMSDYVSRFEKRLLDNEDYLMMWMHEIKTPIASGKLYIENHSNQYTQRLNKDIQQIENYLSTILYYSKIDSLEKDYIIKRCTLLSIVNTAIRENRKSLIEAKVKINVAIEQQEVFCDSKWLNFILNQIIINALKYRKDNPELHFSCKEEKHCITLSIKDNGIGIPDNDLPMVFEKGFTGSNGRLIKQSTGMGLYICKKLSEKLDIDLSIESVVNQYTCVILSFPIGEEGKFLSDKYVR